MLETTVNKFAQQHMAGMEKLSGLISHTVKQEFGTKLKN